MGINPVPPDASASNRGMVNTAAQTLGGEKSFDTQVVLVDIASPGAPAAGRGRLYGKSDGKIYWHHDSGAETDLTSSSGLPVADTTSVVEGSVDATKEMRFEVDGLTTGTTRVLTVPDADGTLTLTGLAQTLTNKTLGSGTVISAIPTINDGIKVTFNPDATSAGINVGAHTADPSALTDGDIWYDSNTNKFRARENGASTDLIGGGSSLPVADTTSIVEGSADATKEMRFEVDGLTTATTRVMTVPDADGTLTLIDLAQTLTNKTLGSGTQLGAQLDVNGQAIGDGTNELIVFSETASAVNEITITNAAAGGDPSITASGDDADIALVISPKGNDEVRITGGSLVLDNTESVRIKDAGGTAQTVLVIDSGNNMQIRHNHTSGTFHFGTQNPSATGHVYLQTQGNNRLGVDEAGGVLLGDNISANSAGRLQLQPTASQIGIVVTLNATPGTGLVIEDSGGTDLFVVDSTGAVTTGTWQGTTIAVDQGGTGQTSYTDGQLLIGNTTGNTLTKATLTEGEGIDITNGGGSITILCEDASDTNKGISELSTTAEIDLGTDTGRTITPKGLNDSIHGAKYITIYAVDYSTALTTGDGKAYFRIPDQLNGMDLIYAGASVGATKPGGAQIIVQIARLRAATEGAASRTAVDMLGPTNLLDIEDGEWDSKDATAQPDIDTSNVNTGDVLRVDIDQVGSTTAGDGLFITLGFRIP